MSPALRKASTCLVCCHLSYRNGSQEPCEIAQSAAHGDAFRTLRAFGILGIVGQAALPWIRVVRQQLHGCKPLEGTRRAGPLVAQRGAPRVAQSSTIGISRTFVPGQDFHGLG